MMSPESGGPLAAGRGFVPGQPCQDRVDVADSAETRQWLQQFKARWKIRLDQLDLWVVSYPIDVE